ncbi:MAG: hypothetical protein R3D00_22750 [Bacteroidia bacterium]
METIYIFCSLLLFSCTGTGTGTGTGTKSESEMNEVLDFLNKKEYRYSVNKSDIPRIVMDSISSINNEFFTIGDSTDEGKISFSDARLFKNGKDIYEYIRELHFTLVSDTACLLVYREGGEGSHDVIDYLKYKGEYTHVRYITTDILSDTVKLGIFLRVVSTFE